MPIENEGTYENINNLLPPTEKRISLIINDTVSKIYSLLVKITEVSLKKITNIQGINYKILNNTKGEENLDYSIIVEELENQTALTKVSLEYEKAKNEYLSLIVKFLELRESHQENLQDLKEFYIELGKKFDCLLEFEIEYADELIQLGKNHQKFRIGIIEYRKQILELKNKRV